MKALVTYYSQSGNTEKLAHAIYSGIEQCEKDIVPVKDVSGTEDYDLVLFGFPVQASSVPGKAEAFIKGIPEGTKLALFATHGSLRGGHLAIEAFYYAITLAKKAKILGTFGSRGTVKPSLIDRLLENPEQRGWALEAQSAIGHPDEADFEDAKTFAKTMVTKART